MAFEEIPEIAKMVLWLAVVFFPLLYLLFAIKKKIGEGTFFKEVITIFILSVLLALGVYPFLAALAEYVIYADSGLEVGLLLFDSDYATYGVVLLVVFLIYLIVFNKDKEE